jgi:hypothetical protein
MKFFKYLWHFIKNILWALIIIIIYFLLIWMIKTWWIVNYFHYLNARDWGVISAQINIFEPHTLTDIFYSSQEISWAMVPEGHILEQNNLTWMLLDSGSVIEETWLNAYDPKFEDDFNNNLDGQYSWNLDGSWSFGFVNTWK